jgi:hypothetical protein
LEKHYLCWSSELVSKPGTVSNSGNRSFQPAKGRSFNKVSTSVFPEFEIEEDFQRSALTIFFQTFVMGIIVQISNFKSSEPLDIDYKFNSNKER